MTPEAESWFEAVTDIRNGLLAKIKRMREEEIPAMEAEVVKCDKALESLRATGSVHPSGKSEP